MFKPIAARTDSGKVTVLIDGEPSRVPVGLSVAAALLLQTQAAQRQTVVSGQLRMPYCMMGGCYDCLVSIDGIQNRQGCMVEVAEGMRIERQLDPSNLASSKPQLQEVQGEF